MIIGLSFSVLMLSVVAVCDISACLKRKDTVRANYNCQQYLEQHDYEQYQKCFEMVKREI
jgi:hypothetical protein